VRSPARIVHLRSLRSGSLRCADELFLFGFRSEQQLRGVCLDDDILREAELGRRGAHERCAVPGYDDDHSESEERWVTLGVGENGLLLVVSVSPVVVMTTAVSSDALLQL
jgi:hypothetical protein